MTGVLLLLVVSLVRAAPEVTETNSYYKVSAATVKSLIPALNAATPVQVDGEVFFAYTNTDVQWRFRYKSNGKRCWVSSVSTTVDATYTLPKLESSSADVRGLWRLWYPNLVSHEQGHKDLAVDIAIAIGSELKALPSYETCEELEQMANQKGGKLLEKLQKLNADYDRRTEHGATQGARLSDYL